MKNQKGSITFFILIAVLFFSIILFTAYNNNMQKLKTEEKDINKIQEIYKKDSNEVYEKTVENSSK